MASTGFKILAITLGGSLCALSGCASIGGGTAADAAGANDIPPEAVATVRTEANGDQITEYRVGGRLRALKVTPSRGPVYYVYDRNGDGAIDKAGDNPPQTYYKLFEFN